MTDLFDLEKLRDASETDLHIANYISNHETSVAFMRVRELAEKTHVSPATIIRFTQKMGFDSFPELRLALKQKQAAENSQSAQQVTTDFYLENTYFPADFQQKIKQLVNLLSQVDVVHCLGTGSSSSMAHYAQQRLSSLGYQSFASVSTFIPYLAAKKEHSDRKQTEICLLFSVSGETPDLIHLAKMLKESSITSVSITNKDVNTLTTLSDFSLSYDTPLKRHSYAVDMSTQLPVVYIIETLVQQLYLTKFPLAKEE